LSKKSWIVAVNTSLSAKVSRNTLKPYNWKELLKLSERIRTRVVEELKKRVDVVSTLPRNSCWLGQLEAMANWTRRALADAELGQFEAVVATAASVKLRVAQRVAARCIEQDVGDAENHRPQLIDRHRSPGGAIGSQLELLADAAFGLAALEG
jgi:hypothetical protein